MLDRILVEIADIALLDVMRFRRHWSKISIVSKSVSLYTGGWNKSSAHCRKDTKEIGPTIDVS